MSIPPTSNSNPNPLKSKIWPLDGTDENEFRAKRKRYSYPLLGSYDSEMQGIQRLPLSPVKVTQGNKGSAADTFEKPINIVCARKGPVRIVPNRRASVSFLDNNAPALDIFDPLNSVAETFPTDFFNFERNRILRRLRKPEDTDSFSVLPDEMVLKIFGLVGKWGLSNCMLVNQRFNALANDEVLWRRTDAGGKFLNPDAVKSIFSRNPVYLRLAKAFIARPTGLDDNFKASQLIYLDLSMAEATPNVLARLLPMCNSLVKCSLEGLPLPTEVMAGMMSFCSSIQTLNIAMSTEVNTQIFSLFLSKSPNLKALNMGCIYYKPSFPRQTQMITNDDLRDIITSLPIGLEKLNASGLVHCIKDEHIETLVGRLSRLKELDLSDSQDITGKSVHAIVQLKSLECLGLSRCYNIPLGAYLLLLTSSHLRSVQLFAIFKQQTMTELKATLPQINFNQEPISSIARPTVGNRRSTIWGERVRD